MSYHLTHVRMAIIKKTSDNKCSWGCGEKGTFVRCWWECKLVQPRRTTWRFLKKLKILTTIWFSNHISVSLSEENKIANLRRYLHPNVHCSIIYNSQEQKQPKCPSMDEWIKKMWSKETTNAGMNVEKRKPLCTVGGIVNWCSHYGKRYGASSKN